MIYVSNLEHKSIDPKVIASLKPKYQLTLNNPKLSLVWQQVKDEISDSIYFHASDLNQEVYNYAYRIWNEQQEKLKAKKGKEEEKKSKNSRDNDIKPNN